MRRWGVLDKGWAEGGVGEVSGPSLATPSGVLCGAGRRSREIPGESTKFVARLTHAEVRSILRLRVG